MLRNKISDILNYFGVKNNLNSHKDSWFSNINPFSGDSKRPPVEPPTPPRPDYEALRQKYDQDWKRRMRDSYPTDNGIKFPLDLSSPYT